jgi:DNA ligase-1
LEAALLRFDEELILDGEIVAWDVDEGRALPFSELQQRIGRKTVDIELLRAVPVAYIAFDVIYADSELVIDLPLTERKRILQEIFARVGARGAGAPFVLPEPANLVRKVRKARGEDGRQQGNLFVAEEPAQAVPDAIEAGVPLPPLLTAPVWRASSAAELEQLFERAQERGNEGLMIKELSSPYSPGRRGKTWLKLKRELATLDVVVTAVEYGHGKRAGVLSDYTFAVRDGEKLLNVGKAYSGLTDVEIAEMTQWFLAHTVEDHGHTRVVEPRIVIEVAFNNVMRSERHESGYALRFPRIVRIRDPLDKTVADIDTVERVQEIFEKQGRKAAS